MVVINMFRLQTSGNDDRRVAEDATELYVSPNPWEGGSGKAPRQHIEFFCMFIDDRFAFRPVRPEALEGSGKCKKEHYLCDLCDSAVIG